MTIAALAAVICAACVAALLCRLAMATLAAITFALIDTTSLVNVVMLVNAPDRLFALFNNVTMFDCIGVTNALT